MIGARRGSPLAIGHGDGEMFFGSDAIALAPFTDRVTYLEDGDWAVLTRTGATIFDEARRRGRTADGPHASRRACWSTTATTATSWRRRSTSSRRSSATRSPTTSTSPPGACALPADFTRRLRGARPPVDHRLRHGLLRRAGRQILVRAVRAAAGRHRYRLRVPLPRAAAAAERAGDRHLAVGRDRRHAGLAALRQGGRARRSPRSSTCATSTIAREADFVLPTLAGPEIGVASTKAFTCQLAVLGALAVAAGTRPRPSVRRRTRRSSSAR